MSVHQAFRRQAVPPQAVQRLEAMTLPAPTRGIIQDENEAYMQPGAALVCDNWVPTLRGVKLRGGCIPWCNLPESTPVISGFSYVSGANEKIFAANATKLYDVTTPTATLVASGLLSGNFSASQFANQAGEWLIAVNDAGDSPLRFNGSTWETLIPGYVPPSGGASAITGPVGSAVEFGKNLVNVCKYRNRLFFVGINSMSAWYLPTYAVGGALLEIPLSGAATKGGHLLFCASWSIDAGDGPDDKLIFVTDLGEILVFTGTDPSSSSNWRQEGRYTISAPMGMNAFLPIGGDLLIATVEGIVPVSAAISKSPEAMELAAITRAIKPMWRNEVDLKRALPWTMINWPQYGGIFVTWPGGSLGNRYCAFVNASTGAWCRFVGYDATCWLRMRDDLFFGCQDGIVMQADRTGYDNGLPYTATLVGGWEMFQSPAQTITGGKRAPRLPPAGPNVSAVFVGGDRLRNRAAPTTASRRGPRRCRRLGSGLVGCREVGSAGIERGHGAQHRMGEHRCDGFFSRTCCAGDGWASEQAKCPDDCD
jgi:hypothetical protein